MNNPFSAKNPESEAAQPLEDASGGDAPVPEDTRPEAGAESVAAMPVSQPEQKVEEAVTSKSPPPALGMDEISCRTCRYLDFKGGSRTAASGGECRRHAPVPGANQLASWPQVTWEGWCGEWESGVSDEDMVKMARAIADEQAEGPAVGFVKGTEKRPVTLPCPGEVPTLLNASTRKIL
jgi:hypothetical protein